jgi:hypothetical protein
VPNSIRALRCPRLSPAITEVWASQPPASNCQGISDFCGWARGVETKTASSADAKNRGRVNHGVLCYSQDRPYLT